MTEKEGSNNSKIIFGIAGAILVVVLLWLVFRSREASVAGLVTLDNEPLAGAQVVFIGENEENQRPYVTQTDAEGKYKVIGDKGAKIPRGKYKVMVSKMVSIDGKPLVGEQILESRENGKLQNMLSPVYEERSTSPLEFDIRSGSNKVNLELKKNP